MWTRRRRSPLCSGPMRWGFASSTQHHRMATVSLMSAWERLLDISKATSSSLGLSSPGRLTTWITTPTIAACGALSRPSKISSGTTYTSSRFTAGRCRERTPSREFEKRCWNQVFGKGLAYETLLKIREQGGCRHIGITADWAPHLQKALEHADFDSIEIAMHYNALCNVARETVLPVAERKNVAVIIATPLSDGRLVSLDAVAKNPHPGVDNDKAIEALGQVMGETGYSLSQVSLLYLLADPRVTSVIPGSSNVTELESNVAVASLNLLSDDQIQRLRTIGSTQRGHIGLVV